MLVFFLIVCTDVHYGIQCLPMQKMPSEKACLFAGQSYQKTAPEFVHTRCIGIRDRG